MSKRLESLRTLCSLTRSSGVNSVRVDLAELEDLLDVAEDAQELVRNQKDGKMNPLAWDALDKSLVKIKSSGIGCRSPE
jgi:hypothetical protein